LAATTYLARVYNWGTESSIVNGGYPQQCCEISTYQSRSSIY